MTVAASSKVALVTGITGQDGSYLAELLLSKGYTVYGLERPSRYGRGRRLSNLLHLTGQPQHSCRLFLCAGDITDFPTLLRHIRDIAPNEIYNLAAQSSVKISFDRPRYTAEVTGQGVLNVLEAVFAAGLAGKTKVFQASSSEMFGNAAQPVCNEETRFEPCSPYGMSKLFGYYMVTHFRTSHKMFACNGILFNHESPRRGEAFVTRKITRAAACIALGLQDCLTLGNLAAKRDWGHARDYVHAMWLMLQQETADDYVIATGTGTTVRRFAELAFSAAGLPVRFSGEGLQEVGVVASGPRKGQVVIRVDPQYFRPADVNTVVGDPSKAMRLLGWVPTATSLERLVSEMVAADMQAVQQHGDLVAANAAAAAGYDVHRRSHTCLANGVQAVPIPTCS